MPNDDCAIDGCTNRPWGDLEVCRRHILESFADVMVADDQPLPPPPIDLDRPTTDHPTPTVTRVTAEPESE